MGGKGACPASEQNVYNETVTKFLDTNVLSDTILFLAFLGALLLPSVPEKGTYERKKHTTCHSVCKPTALTSPDVTAQHEAQAGRRPVGNNV